MVFSYVEENPFRIVRMICQSNFSTDRLDGVSRLQTISVYKYQGPNRNSARLNPLGSHTIQYIVMREIVCGGLSILYILVYFIFLL